MANHKNGFSDALCGFQIVTINMSSALLNIKDYVEHSGILNIFQRFQLTWRCSKNSKTYFFFLLEYLISLLALYHIRY